MSAARTLGMLALGFAAGAGAMAWVADRGPVDQGTTQPMRSAPQSTTAASTAIAAAPADSPPTAALGQTVVASTPDPAAPPKAKAATATAPEPPASWMTIEQQRAAAAAYREWVRDAGRLALERQMNLNAELFLIEAQDPTWGATMESKVRAAMADDAVFAGIELEGIECRVTVCRAVLRFPEADSPQGLPNGGRSIWSAWRGAQIVPNRAEINDGVPGFRVTVYLGDDFDRSQVTPRDPRNRGPGGP